MAAASSPWLGATQDAKNLIECLARTSINRDGVVNTESSVKFELHHRLTALFLPGAVIG